MRSQSARLDTGSDRAARKSSQRLWSVAIDAEEAAAHPLHVSEPNPAGDRLQGLAAVFDAGPRGLGAQALDGARGFEAALLVAEAAYGRGAAELVIEYDPHPPFGVGAVNRARREQVAQFEGLMSHMVAEYRTGAVAAFQAASK
jgi:hypothetical protein